MSEIKPAAGLLGALTDEEFSRFIYAVGWIAFRSVPMAAFARHKKPSYTIADYLDLYPDDGPVWRLAKQYSINLARGMKTDELSKKWFGQTASELQAEAVQWHGEQRERRRRND